MDWIVTFGIPQGRGGMLITEQRIIAADDYITASNFANCIAMRNERVVSIEESLTNV